MWLRLLIKDHPPSFCLFFSLLTSQKGAWVSGEPHQPFGRPSSHFNGIVAHPGSPSLLTRREEDVPPLFIKVCDSWILRGNHSCHHSSEVRKRSHCSTWNWRQIITQIAKRAYLLKEACHIMRLFRTAKAAHLKYSKLLFFFLYHCVVLIFTVVSLAFAVCMEITRTVIELLHFHIICVQFIWAGCSCRQDDKIMSFHAGTDMQISPCVCACSCVTVYRFIGFLEKFLFRKKKQKRSLRTFHDRTDSLDDNFETDRN